MMSSFINVSCPKCKASGRLEMPSAGALPIGPCPKCSEPVVIFLGQALALDKRTMEKGSLEQQEKHLLEVFDAFLKRRVRQLLENAGGYGDHSEAITNGGSPENSGTPISQKELENFADTDLKLLDNRDYFKSVFE